MASAPRAVTVGPYWDIVNVHWRTAREIAALRFSLSLSAEEAPFGDGFLNLPQLAPPNVVAGTLAGPIGLLIEPNRVPPASPPNAGAAPAWCYQPIRRTGQETVTASHVRPDVIRAGAALGYADGYWLYVDSFTDALGGEHAPWTIDLLNEVFHRADGTGPLPLATLTAELNLIAGHFGVEEHGGFPVLRYARTIAVIASHTESSSVTTFRSGTDAAVFFNLARLRGLVAPQRTLAINLIAPGSARRWNATWSAQLATHRSRRKFPVDSDGALILPDDGVAFAQVRHDGSGDDGVAQPPRTVTFTVDLQSLKIDATVD